MFYMHHVRPRIQWTLEETVRLGELAKQYKSHHVSVTQPFGVDGWAHLQLPAVGHTEVCEYML